MMENGWTKKIEQLETELAEVRNNYDKLLELAEEALYELECLVPALDSFHQARNTIDELREITR